MNVTLPYNYQPRLYQRPAWIALANGAKKIVKVDHRRSGKDLDAWNMTIVEAAKNVGIYYYFFPKFAQGKKVIWEGMTNEGRPFLDFVPKEIRDGKPKENDMQVKIKTKKDGKKATSIIQILGTDDYDNLLGTNQRWGVYSEYMVQDPRAREFFKPIFEANDGVEIFCYTPRGPVNHGKKLYDTAVEEVEVHRNPEWYVERLSILDTFKGFDQETGKPIPITSVDAVERLIAEGMDRATAMQEFYCKFETGESGAFYADLIERIKKEGRVKHIDWEPGIPVDTFWDIGYGDDMCIWFYQNVLGEHRWIDCLDDHGKSIGHYLKILEQKPYKYGRHVGPHDLYHGSAHTGQSLWNTAFQLGVRFEPAPEVSIEDGRDQVRMMLTKSNFDIVKCKKGLDALIHHHRRWDHKNKRHLTTHNKDWSVHYSDAFRYACLAISDKPSRGRSRIKVVNNFNVYAN